MSLGLTPISFLGHSALVAAAGPIAPGKRSIFQTFWKLHCVTKSLFFETSTFGYTVV